MLVCIWTDRKWKGKNRLTPLITRPNLNSFTTFRRFHQHSLLTLSLFSLFPFSLFPFSLFLSSSFSLQSYTMEGPSHDRGVNYRALSELFTLCSSTPDTSFTISMSV